MSRFHLREETFCHVREVECTTLLRNDTVEEDLQEQVAEFFAQHAVVAGANGVIDLIRFLDQIWAQRLVSLRRIPLAAQTKILS